MIVRIAVALCSMHARGVAMSDALLARLDANEATAVFAHEIAHHEHHDDALLRKRWRWTYVLAALVIVVPPLQLATELRYSVMIDFAVLVAILLLFARGQASHRAHETDSRLMRRSAPASPPVAHVRGPPLWEPRGLSQHPAPRVRRSAHRPALGAPGGLPRMRSSGRAMPTRSRSAIPCRQASRRPTSLCRRIASTRWSPIE